MNSDKPRGAWKPNRRWPALLGTIDFGMVALAVLVNQGAPRELLIAFAVAVPLVALMTGIYSTRLHFDALARAPHMVGVVTAALMLLVTLDFLGVELGATPQDVLGLWLAGAVLVPLGRLLAAPVYNALFRKGDTRRAIIIGSGFAAVLVAEKIETHPELGLVTAGFVDDGPRTSVRGRSEPLVGDVCQIHDIIDSTGAEVAIFAYTHNPTEEMLIALYQMPPKVEVLMMPRFFQFVSAGMKVEDLAGLPLLRLHRHELTAPERFVKRAEDLIIGGLAALLLLPLLPLIALAIKLDSPGPVFFKHERIGLRGKPFYMYKFRSMSDGADKDNEALEQLGEDDARGLKNKADSRITKVGAFLRKSSIDELPQVINVLKGEMSLVGPRPAVAAEVAVYDEWQKKRLSVAPGITGIWQVNGRSDVPFDERIWLDFMYIDSWSVWLDLSVMLKTIPAVLTAKGAY
ncbi:MAG: sugar transferase [Coriobacteriia bacterium]|nr:sugar transferase [Coriobacteriia bacterium]